MQITVACVCFHLGKPFSSKIEGKSAEMVVDSGCMRTLVHKRFVKNDALTGDKISVLTATGEHLIVPLAWVEIESGQGKHAELVGVLDKLPVDCLPRRSFFRQTLSRENVLEYGEKELGASEGEGAGIVGLVVLGKTAGGICCSVVSLSWRRKRTRRELN